jgi:hypothetical protein
MTRALLGLSAIARRLHISRQRIYVLAMHADHPQYDHSGDEAAA